MQGKVVEKEPEALEAELLGFLILKLQVKYGETNRIWCKPRINVIQMTWEFLLQCKQELKAPLPL